MTEVEIRRTHCGQAFLCKPYVNPSIGKAQRIRYTVVFCILGSQDSDSIFDQVREGFKIPIEFAISELSRILIEIDRIGHDEIGRELPKELLCNLVWLLNMDHQDHRRS